MSGFRVLRVYHEGGNANHRARDRALLEAGVNLTLVSPSNWPGSTLDDVVPHRRLPVRRAGDVNRHVYADGGAVRDLVRTVRPDLLDIHEEPVSLSARQWTRAAGDVPTVMYTAQNLDKRWPPPYAQYERQALGRVRGFYPCSAQAASVLRGKGYEGLIRVLPLGVDAALNRAGNQELPCDEVVMGFVGRLVPEKGLVDAVQVLAAVNQSIPARLLVIGSGPDELIGRRASQELKVDERCEWIPWTTQDTLAQAYRRMHLVLVPSRATTRWVEQFGRVITEAAANGAVPVGYSSGSIPEVIAEAGLLVDEGDVRAMGLACVSLVSDPARWQALRTAALSRACAMHWPRVAAGQIALYRAAIESNPRQLQRAKAATRRAAADEFGLPADTPGGRRPFALPMLREPGSIQTYLAAFVDAITGQR